MLCPVAKHRALDVVRVLEWFSGYHTEHDFLAVNIYEQEILFFDDSLRCSLF